MRTSNQKLLLIFLNFHLIRIQIHYLHLDRKRRFLIFKFLNLWFTHFPLTSSQGFKNKPKVFITVQHKHTDRPYDSMNLWLENVSKNKFNLCMREFMAFDGIHSDLKVVRWLQNFAINEQYCAQIEVTESYVIPEVHVRRKMSLLVLSSFFFASSICVFRPFIPLFHNSLVYIFLA